MNELKLIQLFTLLIPGYIIISFKNIMERLRQSIPHTGVVPNVALAPASHLFRESS
jgi:hypothetical protein